MPYICKCNIVEFSSDILMRQLGREWNLGPVVLSKEPGSDLLSVFVANDTLTSSLVSLNEFKSAVLSTNNLPFHAKFSISGERGTYGFGEIEFDEDVVCRYLETKYSMGKTELVLELCAKGKELRIFNGNSGDTKRSGEQKPLFWASLLKRDIHK